MKGGFHVLAARIGAGFLVLPITRLALRCRARGYTLVVRWLHGDAAGLVLGGEV